MPTFGPFSVVGPDVHTGVIVVPGDGLNITATGSVNFGGIGGPVLGPDGDSWKTPTDYPAPALRKNSLIYRFGNGTTWYQGGSLRAPVVPFGESGGLVLRTNDKNVGDNSGSWAVTVTHSPLPRPTPLPNAPYLQISSMEIVQTVQTPTNQVPLIANKPTLVRVYVDSGLTSGLDVGAGPNLWPDVTGYLTVADSRGYLIGVGALLNQPKAIVARPAVGIDRNNPDHSLNFSISPGLLAPGRYVFTATAYVANKFQAGAGWRTSQVQLGDFDERPTVQQLQPILVGDGLRNIPAPAFSTWVSDLFNGVVPRLPFAIPRLRINSPMQLTSNHDLESWIGGQLLVLDLATMVLVSTGSVGGPRCGVLPSSATRPFGGLGAARVLVSVPALIYGAGDGAAFAHELGHAFGVGHSPGCGAPPPIDSRLPSNGRTDATGWNAATGAIIPSGSNDLMSWCRGGEWPSRNFYRIVAEADAI